MRAGRQYICLPTLDGSVPPSEEEFALLLQRIANHPGAVLVHCASGRGRAIATVAGVLILRGMSADVAAALTLPSLKAPADGWSVGHTVSQWQR